MAPAAGDALVVTQLLGERGHDASVRTVQRAVAEQGVNIAGAGARGWTAQSRQNAKYAW